MIKNVLRVIVVMFFVISLIFAKQDLDQIQELYNENQDFYGQEMSVKRSYAINLTSPQPFYPSSEISFVQNNSYHLLYEAVDDLLWERPSESPHGNYSILEVKFDTDLTRVEESRVVSTPISWTKDLTSIAYDGTNYWTVYYSQIGYQLWSFNSDEIITNTTIDYLDDAYSSYFEFRIPAILFFDNSLWIVDSGISIATGAEYSNLTRFNPSTMEFGEKYNFDMRIASSSNPSFDLGLFWYRTTFNVAKEDNTIWRLGEDRYWDFMYGTNLTTNQIVKTIGNTATLFNPYEYREDGTIHDVDFGRPFMMNGRYIRHITIYDWAIPKDSVLFGFYIDEFSNVPVEDYRGYSDALGKILRLILYFGIYGAFDIIYILNSKKPWKKQVI